MSFAYINSEEVVNNELNALNIQMRKKQTPNNYADCNYTENHTCPIRNIMITSNKTEAKLKNTID